MQPSEAHLSIVTVPFNVKGSKSGTAECAHSHVMTCTHNFVLASTLLLVCNEQPLQLLMIKATAERCYSNTSYTLTSPEEMLEESVQQQCHTLNRSGFFMGQTTSSWIRRLA